MTEATKLFSKSLTDTDTRKRLAIPAKILPDLPDFNGNHAVNLRLMYGTKVWPIVCSVRKNGYKKPVLSGGWRSFVVYNDFSVGDELTLYKVHGKRGCCYYRVEVEKPPNPSGNISPRDQAADGTMGTCATKVADFECDKELPFKADAPMKGVGAIVEPASVAVSFVDRVVSKPSCWVFGTNLSEEISSKAQSKTEMGEPPLRPYYKIKEENDAMGNGYDTRTSQASGEPRASASHSLDLVLRL
ncbi:hypothetical protein HRI_000731700 [Hibiscus trionum]|uniref:TF-B3 domain-containing protein n=1 Tax=Hibiscus trionum TaxID=183268 RepID=A0A9W7LN57_HIBTR|nr:hypothetical protein HRI_000731700 [Hibiscus trionum]